MSMPVPTLDTSGYVAGIAQKADRLFSYWLVSKYSQSNMFLGRIRPFPWLLQQYGTAPNDLQVMVREALLNLFDGYFDSVTVNVNVSPYVNDDSRLDVRIDLWFTDGQNQYSLGKVLSTTGTILSKIVTFNPGNPAMTALS